MSTIKPIDVALVEETARKVKLLVTAEDHQISGGLAGAVAEVLSQTYPKKSIESACTTHSANPVNPRIFIKISF